MEWKGWDENLIRLLKMYLNDTSIIEALRIFHGLYTYSYIVISVILAIKSDILSGIVKEIDTKILNCWVQGHVDGRIILFFIF